MPCKPDHNGECLVCDCWMSNCAFNRLLEGNFCHETLDELLEMFKKFLTPEKIRELKAKHDAFRI